METLPVWALSVRQPWACALISGVKDFENRTTFALKHMNFDKLDGGILAIHASSGMTQDEYLDARIYCRDKGFEVPPPDLMAYGAIIGTMRVVQKGTFKVACSKWMNGNTGILLADPVPLQQPIPAKGALGLFQWGNDREPMPPRSLKPWMEKFGRESLPKPMTKSAFQDLFEGGHHADQT